MATIVQCDECGTVLEKKSYGYYCIHCYLQRTRVANGLLVPITDPLVLHDIAVLLGPIVKSR